MLFMDDDDDEVVVKAVNNYYFVENDEPVSFSELDIQFDDDKVEKSTNRDIFLNGVSEDGLEKVHKKVVSWKLGLQEKHPVISVLSKEGEWITLLKPRKSFECIIRSILVTVQMIHFLKSNPDASEKDLWGKLRSVFYKFEVEPSQDDFVDHHSLVKLFADRDKNLAKSQIMLNFLQRKSSKKAENFTDRAKRQAFIIDDDDEDDNDDNEDENDEEDSDEDSEMFDSVCAICDNGGDILCCEGPCMRSFHPTVKSGAESECESLKFTSAQVKSMLKFLCENCKYKQHQCFACGELGSSDKSDTEVYKCVNAFCGYFYHPKCVAQLLHPGSVIDASDCQNKIVAGEPFTCPLHRCLKCKKGEDKSDEELQFALCRRCPKAFHKKCLPREIAFDDNEEDILPRAWKGLLPNRILIYCQDHEIVEHLGTPVRNHLKYPASQELQCFSTSQKERIKILARSKRPASIDSVVDHHQAKQSSKSAGVFPQKKERIEHGRKEVRTPTNQTAQSVKKISLKEKVHSEPLTFDSTSKRTAVKPVKKDTSSATNPSYTEKIPKSGFPEVDDKTVEGVIKRTESTSSFLTVEFLTKRFAVPSTHSSSGKYIERAITRGKVDGSVQAVLAALRKFEGGGSVEDAEQVCEPQVLNQLNKWDSKLRVYLAPFLHGMRYTSFGRHFTKREKLQEIVDRLHWYVQEGDMIVDFCCGSNDFSILMKKKLDEVGKVCSFKNFDVITPKNNFCFEKRDWMKVEEDELPTGSKLIMGLNPPFGIKAALANKFIDKALKFMPKLIILIVPKETERLDKKIPSYKLVWEDAECLSGKSFYLPGSVDVNDRQMEQWNVSPPLLFLWSHPDYAFEHSAIAQKMGHETKTNPVRKNDLQDEFALKGRNIEDGLDEDTKISGPQETMNVRFADNDSLQERPESLPPERYVEVAYEETNLSEYQRDAVLEHGEGSFLEGKVSNEVHVGETRHKRIRLQKKQVVTTDDKAESPSDMSLSQDQQKPVQTSGKGNYLTYLNEREVLLSGQGRYNLPIDHYDTTYKGGISAGDEVADISMKYMASEKSLHGPSGYNWSGMENRIGNYRNQIFEERCSGVDISHASSLERDFGGGPSSSPHYGMRASLERHAEFASPDPFYRDLNREEHDVMPSRFSSQRGNYLHRGTYPYGSSVNAYEQPNARSPLYGLPSLSSGLSAMDRYAPRLSETNYHPSENLESGGHPLSSGNLAHQGYVGPDIRRIGRMHDIPPGVQNDVPTNSPGFIQREQYPPHLHPGSSQVRRR